jgi:peptide/nickel transport system permease protein
MRRWAAAMLLLPLAMVVALAVLGVLFGTAEPARLHLSEAWQPPRWSSPLGHGDAGLDLLAAVCHATLRVLGLSFAVAGIGFIVGTPLGAAAGLKGGAVERVTLGGCDLVQSFPSFLLALAVLAAVPQPERWHIGAVFALTAWAPYARLSAVQARVLSQSQFVEAARALGAGRWRILQRHVLPNLLGPVSVQLGTSAAAVVLGETALGFVGLGPGDGLSLGALLDQGVSGLLRSPHVLAFSALAVIFVSGGLQLGSEALRRWLRPS